MPIKITDSDNITTIYTAERLQINLVPANENVEAMIIEVYFNVETKLPNGKTVGVPYWEGEPLFLNCKGNPELTKAMEVIQQAIGLSKHKKLTTPKEPEKTNSVVPSIETKINASLLKN